MTKYQFDLNIHSINIILKNTCLKHNSGALYHLVTTCFVNGLFGWAVTVFDFVSGNNVSDACFSSFLAISSHDVSI